MDETGERVAREPRAPRDPRRGRSEATDAVRREGAASARPRARDRTLGLVMRSSTPSSDDPELVERAVQIGSVAVDTESPGRRQLVPAIATGEQADAQHSCAPRGKQIPHRVADYVAVARVDAELLLAPQEEVRLGFRAEDVAAS